MIATVTLWFETHATSVDNERGIASGHLDAVLSELGREQARQLGARYGEQPPAIVYTSDLRRAWETAEIAFAGWSQPLIKDPRLRECDYGRLSGCAVEQLDPVRLRFIETRFPGGESYRDATRRVEEFLAALPHAEQPVLIIGHRATWYSLEHLLRKRELREVINAPWRWQPGWAYESGTP
jgi:broad specificity phosphatase PhoE